MPQVEKFKLKKVFCYRCSNRTNTIQFRIKNIFRLFLVKNFAYYSQILLF